MNQHYFPEALASAIRQLSLTPDQLKTFETAHVLAGEPLPHQNYCAIFSYFLAAPKRAHLAAQLARACLADTLLECGLDEETIARLSAPTERDASVVHLFRKLSVIQLLALSIIGQAAARNEGVHDALLALAELSRAVVKDKTLSRGFFRQHMSPEGEPKRLQGGSIGATAGILAEEAES